MKKTFRQGFECLRCRQWVPTRGRFGTRHRNHCPFCLWSRHVDRQKSGDRATHCGEPMEPIGLTFKHEGTDKYGQPRQGELMLIHRCQTCDRFSINRLAADDNPTEIKAVFEKSLKSGTELTEKIAQENIALLSEKDRPEVETQLFGKTAGN